MTKPIENPTHPVVRVTVITVTLNSARHVARAVESVIAQDDPALEYLVIDGGSSDTTVATVESYRSHFGSRLHVRSESDQGLYYAMNKGLALATGDVVGILNSDDAYLPGAIAAVRAAFTATDADVVFGDLQLADVAGGRILHATMTGLEREMTIFHPSTFVRASVYRQWGGFDTRFRIAADYDLLLRIRGRGARFARIDRVLTAFAPGGASGRPLPLALEAYAIHRRHVSTPHAIACFAARLANAGYLSSRRWLGHALLGDRRYDRLSARFRTGWKAPR